MGLYFCGYSEADPALECVCVCMRVCVCVCMCDSRQSVCPQPLCLPAAPQCTSAH